MQKVLDDSPLYNSYTKQDMLNMLEFVEELGNTKYLNPHMLWDVPPKKHTNELYEEGEMTEEDI